MTGKKMSRVALSDAEEDVRILRRLDLKEGPTGIGNDENARICAVVDCETTGLDHDADAMIQFAMRRFRYDAEGIITDIDRSFSWYEDPGRPVPEEIVRLTGITDGDVRGRRFPDEDIAWALSHVELVVGHNAAFDRKWIERRFEGARRLPWACSMSDIEWDRNGFDGRKLAFLAMQCGFYYEAHRADIDVDAVIALLQHRFDDGRTAMSEMMANAIAPSWLVSAEGAPFDMKDRLRARGYRWDPKRKVWAREVRDAALSDERRWLDETVYPGGAGPPGYRPRIDVRTRWTRYA